MVPLANRLEATTLGCLKLVQGTMVLGILQVLVLGMAVVQDLQLHACSGRAPFTRVMDPQAVVATRWKQENKLKDPI